MSPAKIPATYYQLREAMKKVCAPESIWAVLPPIATTLPICFKISRRKEFTGENGQQLLRCAAFRSADLLAGIELRPPDFRAVEPNTLRDLLVARVYEPAVSFGTSDRNLTNIFGPGREMRKLSNRVLAALRVLSGTC